MAGAGVFLVGDAANNYSRAGDRVSDCVASVITTSAEMLRIVRAYKLDLNGLDTDSAADSADSRG